MQSGRRDSLPAALSPRRGRWAVGMTVTRDQAQMLATLACDLSDLEQANESHRARAICYPDYLPFGARFKAICGADAVARGIFTDEDGGCDACDYLNRTDYRCPRCGA